MIFVGKLTTVLVVVLAICLFLLKQSDWRSNYDNTTVLGVGKYNIKILDAPVANGIVLHILSAVLNSPILGNALRRMLLNDNGLYHLPELAAQTKIPPLHFPMHRVSAEEWNIAHQLSQASDTSINLLISSGLKNSPTHNSKYRTVTDYHEAYLSGRTKPSLVLKNTLETYEKWHRVDGFKIFSSIIPENVMKEALDSDNRYKKNQSLSVFDGVPVAFKDMMDLKGHTIFDGRKPSESNAAFARNADIDDTIVTKFRKAGAIMFGVTIMTEGGMSPMGYNAHFKGPVSPFNIHRYSGGSSGGSSVAVATGIVPVAIGFDGGGSVRLPAAMSGVHGLATTFGRIPFDSNTHSTNIKCGPFATNTNDLSLAYGLISSSSENHFYTKLYDGARGRGPPPSHLHPKHHVDSNRREIFGEVDLSDVRLGIFKEWFEDADPLVVRETYKAVEYLRSRGATIIDEINIPHMQELSLSHGLKIASEFASGYAKSMSLNSADIEPATRIVVGLGSSTTALEILSAEKLRAWAFDYVKGEIFHKHNLTAMLTPVIPGLPPILTDAAKVAGESNTAETVKTLRYVFLGNFLGLPGYSLPIAYTKTTTNGVDHKLPLNLQILGDHWSEHHLLRLANVLETEYVNKKYISQSTSPDDDASRAVPLYFHDPLAV